MLVHSEVSRLFVVLALGTVGGVLDVLGRRAEDEQTAVRAVLDSLIQKGEGDPCTNMCMDLNYATRAGSIRIQDVPCLKCLHSARFFVEAPGETLF